MKPSYFELIDDVTVDDRWHLDGLTDAAGREFDEREFAYGLFVDVTPPFTLWLADEDRKVEVARPLQVSVQYEGVSLDVTFAGLGMLVVKQHLGELLVSMAGIDVQVVPVRVAGSDESYCIVNVVSLIDCIDVRRSEIEWWEDGNEIRPDLAGTPRMVSKLVIDPARTLSRNILRPKGWERSIIISDAIKKLLQDAGATGVQFQDVTIVEPATSEETISQERRALAQDREGQVSVPSEPKYGSFYRQLFAPLQATLGKVDELTISAVMGFDWGGPLSFATIGSQSGGGPFVTYASCELAVREKQVPASFGRYELLVTCDDEQWVRSVISDIGRMTFYERFDHGHTVDIGPRVGDSARIQGILFDEACTVVIRGAHYGVLRCIGITRSEMHFARREGAAALLERLRRAGVYPKTSAHRESVC